MLLLVTLSWIQKQEWHNSSSCIQLNNIWSILYFQVSNSIRWFIRNALARNIEPHVSRTHSRYNEEGSAQGGAKTSGDRNEKGQKCSQRSTTVGQPNVIGRSNFEARCTFVRWFEAAFECIILVSYATTGGFIRLPPQFCHHYLSPPSILPLFTRCWRTHIYELPFELEPIKLKVRLFLKRSKLCSTITFHRWALQSK